MTNPRPADRTGAGPVTPDARLLPDDEPEPGREGIAEGLALLGGLEFVELADRPAGLVIGPEVGEPETAPDAP